MSYHVLLRAELEKHLRELQKGVERSRDMNVPANEVEMECDLFDLHWEERLQIEKSAELRGSLRTACSVLLNEDFGLGKLTEPQKPYSPGSYPLDLGPTVTETWKKQNQERIEAITIPEAARISYEYHDLLTQVERATHAIRKGNPPDLEFLLDDQQQKENHATRVQKNMDRLRATPNPEDSRDR